MRSEFNSSRGHFNTDNMKIAFTGDVMLGRIVNKYINLNKPSYVLGNTLPILKKADIRIINLECCISSYKERWDKTPKVFFFRADPIAIDVLKEANIDYVSLANNHTLDFKEKALLDTIKLLDNAEIKHAGAGKNLSEAKKPAILKFKNIKISVISYSDHPYEFKATKTMPGINLTDIDEALKDFSRIKKEVKNAKKISDLLVFSIHWGPNMQLRPSDNFKEFAHKITDAGVDILHGHSAHIFQGVEIYKNKLIIYDSGDFIDDYYVGSFEKNDQQFLYLVTIKDKKIQKLDLIPVLINNCQVNLADKKTFNEIYDRFKMLCREMGTKVVKEKDKLVIKIL